MASTEAPLNGNDSMPYDYDDPELQRQNMRPPDIDADMKEMDRRRRVDVILTSQVFREELERIIDGQLNDGYTPGSLSALQQVTELLMPGATSRSSGVARMAQSGPPINDIRGVDGLKYAKGEKLLRCKLAAVYRLVELYGWSMGIYNHITVRVSQDQEHFLLNPFGLQYQEITASSLLKVDMQGALVDPGSTNFSFNKAGFILHSAIHSARPDIKAILHLHYPPCVAVSAMKQGLMMVSQEAAIIGQVSYHDYRGLLIDAQEREQIARALGPSNKVLILRNHGVVTCGESLEEALYLMQNLVMACETQIRLAQIGLENVRLLPEESVEQVRAVIKDAGAAVQGNDDNNTEQRRQTKKWKIWDLEFEAQMRMLDNGGFRTGYIYKQPLLRAESTRTRYDVEVPPAVTSSGNQFEEDKWLSPLRKLVAGRKTQDKLSWVNTPNAYQKIEVLETGTNNPKSITKWEAKGDGSVASPIKIESNTQFIPNGGDPNEFKRKQREMKEVRMKNMITSGPQSQILEGVNWEEVQRTNADGSTTHHVMMVGAASKGIIQREYQHNATVYKSAYAKNPFDNVTDEELDEYRRLIERKQRGEEITTEIPDHVRVFLQDPANQHPRDIASPTSPTSMMSDDEDYRGGRGVHRSHSAKIALQATVTEADVSVVSERSQKGGDESFFRGRFRSERKPNKKSDHNGEDKKRSSSKDPSPVKDDKKKDKKDKKEKDKKEKSGGGIRSSFFGKKKSKSKDEPQAAS